MSFYAKGHKIAYNTPNPYRSHLRRQLMFELPLRPLKLPELLSCHFRFCMDLYSTYSFNAIVLIKVSNLK